MTDSDLQESGWEELRKEARKVEGDIEVKLSSYAKLGARFTNEGSYSLLTILSFSQLHSILKICVNFTYFLKSCLEMESGMKIYLVLLLDYFELYE
jgi:hypothetical protein